MCPVCGLCLVLHAHLARTFVRVKMQTNNACEATRGDDHANSRDRHLNILFQLSSL